MELPDIVLSEVHLGCDPINDSINKYVNSRFVFQDFSKTDTQEHIEYNEDNGMSNENDDLEPPRRHNNKDVIFIQHRLQTCLNEVGVQVWMASFLMADLVLNQPHRFENKIVLELGVGVGLDAVVLSMCACKLLCTDFLPEALKLCHRNLKLNKHLIKKVTIPQDNEFDRLTNQPTDVNSITSQSPNNAYITRKELRSESTSHHENHLRNDDQINVHNNKINDKQETIDFCINDDGGGVDINDDNDGSGVNDGNESGDDGGNDEGGVNDDNESDDDKDEEFSCLLLDWTKSLQANVEAWSVKDHQLVESVDVIVASDVIFSDELTTHLFNTILQLVNCNNKQCIIILIAVEKRLNFTLTEAEITCPAYNHFLELVQDLCTLPYSTLYQFECTQVEDIKQSFLYQRSPYLEMWEIKAIRRKSQIHES